MKRRTLSRALALYGAALIACLCALFPVYRIIAMSFMPPADTFAIPPKWLFTPTLESYRELFAGFQGIDVHLYLRNSLAVALGSTLSIAPPVLLMLILQKWMVRGLTMGATKG